MIADNGLRNRQGGSSTYDTFGNPTRSVDTPNLFLFAPLEDFLGASLGISVWGNLRGRRTSLVA